MDHIILINTGFSSKEQLDNYNSWTNDDYLDLALAKEAYKGKMSSKRVERILMNGKF